jgi:predicted nucleotidyltransferase
VQEPELDVRTLLEQLTAAGVRFVLIGGLAVAAQGHERPTFDFDAAYARDPANFEALAVAIAPLQPRLRNAPPDLPFRWDARTIRSGANFTLDTTAGWADFLGDVQGVTSFAELWERAEATELYGIPVRIASVLDLLAMKRAAGRPKDLADITALEAIARLREEEN